jgi:hypothetical protein
MLKSGFTGLTVSVSLKQRLNETARASGFSSVPALLESLLAGTCTCNSIGLVSAGLKPREKGLETGSFIKAGWCGGQRYNSDFNPPYKGVMTHSKRKCFILS